MNKVKLEKFQSSTATISLVLFGFLMRSMESASAPQKSIERMDNQDVVTNNPHCEPSLQLPVVDELKRGRCRQTHYY
jgi:hypothetical protein